MRLMDVLFAECVTRKKENPMKLRHQFLSTRMQVCQHKLCFLSYGCTPNDCSVLSRRLENVKDG